MSDDHAATPARAQDVEARLRAVLARKAGGDPDTLADWGDLAGRLAASTRRRQRVLAAAAALALVVGAAGGYLGEVAASAGTVAARPGSGSGMHRAGASGGTSALAPSAAAPGVMCPDGSGTGTSGTGTSGTGTSGTGTSGTGTSGSGASSSDGIGSATRLFIRTTTDGVTIRAYQDAESAVSSCGVAPTPAAGSGSGSGSGVNSPPGSTGSMGSTGSTGSAGPSIMPLVPAAPDVTVELSDNDAVGQGAISAPVCAPSTQQGSTGSSGGTGAGSGAVPVPPSEGGSPPVDTPDPPATTPTTTGAQTAAGPQSQPQELATGTFGVLEGDPVWWVAVEVGTGVTSVQMTFPDGGTDQMAPVNGIAVLAHRVSAAVASVDPGPDVVRGSLQLLGSGGSVVATVSLPQEATPVPVPTPTPLNEATPSESPGVVVACPPPATLTPKSQSSGITENR
jgi:hypothetical protein